MDTDLGKVRVGFTGTSLEVGSTDVERERPLSGKFHPPTEEGRYQKWEGLHRNVQFRLGTGWGLHTPVRPKEKGIPSEEVRRPVHSSGWCTSESSPSGVVRLPSSRRRKQFRTCTKVVTRNLNSRASRKVLSTLFIFCDGGVGKEGVSVRVCVGGGGGGVPP